MKWPWLAALAAAFLVCVAGAVASSPWLVWYTLPHHDHQAVVFANNLPDLVEQPATLDFTALIDRWRYVAAHRSGRAWRETALTLATRPVPIWPAALLYTERWFDDPTVIMATKRGTTLRLLAQVVETRSAALNPSRSDGTNRVFTTGLAQPQEQGSAAGEGRLVLPATPAADSLDVMIPGSAVQVLPVPLREAWNALLHRKLGLTATSPDIMAAAAQYPSVRISIHGANSAVGIAGASDKDVKAWEAQVERWVVDEDRFRRPVTQAFRLPDRTLGREVVAGLPGAVWHEEPTGTCHAPLPEKPALWGCTDAEQSVLATYPWQTAPQPRDQREWYIRVGQDFLASMPELASLRVVGSGEVATGEITTK